MHQSSPQPIDDGLRMQLDGDLAVEPTAAGERYAALGVGEPDQATKGIGRCLGGRKAGGAEDLPFGQRELNFGRR